MKPKTTEISTDKYQTRRQHRRLSLAAYDLLLLLFVDILIFGIYPNEAVKLDLSSLLAHLVLSASCIFGCRYLACVYRQVWRYGGASAYIRLILADMIAGILYPILQAVLPLQRIAFICASVLVALNLLLSLSLRLLYLYLYQYIKSKPSLSGFVWKLVELVTALPLTSETNRPPCERVRINIAIVGAGRVGVMLADELRMNPRSSYRPCCFIDIDQTKIGREIAGIPVLAAEEATAEKISALSVQEIVFAMTQTSAERKKELYEHYRQTGCKLKVYDLVMQNADTAKWHIRDFEIEDLLFRQPVELHSDAASAYYKGKVILITGGGGSIGSELCRQIARMEPKCLIILDIYENGAYDVQQELRIMYGERLNLQVKIVSICDRAGLEKIFARYRPDILIHAAAHKHVPLMEYNCCEAVKNNVFGTLNVVELCEKYKVGRFMMISTDKAVNPTNVMGATKRLCELLVLSHSLSGSPTAYSATRFGNVLGSAGAVIPLFKRQIMNGGPVTVTDKRVIRYFMTIPEASQLVLQSGAMANDGELFVLDMGKPVRILELAENMIRLSGYEPYQDIAIIETGLRPGEKLFEELLIQPEKLDKTGNHLIFIERERPLPLDVVNAKLNTLRTALATEDDDIVRAALKAVVPTFYEPEDINRTAHKM